MVRINREFFNERFGFSGEVETELQYNPIRWYDPAVGRWLNEDPVGCNFDEVNFTSYVAPRESSTEQTVAREKG
jgi:RHS repeat-associated protein